MEYGRETHRPLGVVLVEQGLVSSDDVDGALAAQVETSQPLGEILLERALLARPLLAKALAAQRGRLLEKEGGFGSGLMARLEQVHLVRRGLPTELPCEEADTAVADPCASLPVYEEAVDPQVELLRRREEELDRRERELAKEAERLARKETKLKRAAMSTASVPPAA